VAEVDENAAPIDQASPLACIIEPSPALTEERETELAEETRRNFTAAFQLCLENLLRNP
jgi:hypothetical protein